MPGVYKVTIRKTEIIGGPPADSGADDDGGGAAAPPAKERALIPEKYGRTATSGLEATVAAEGENHFSFELEG